MAKSKDTLASLKAQLARAAADLVAAQAAASIKVYDNNGTFVLFKSQGKTKPTSPDFYGFLTSPAGKKFRLAAWLHDGPKGQRLSGRLSEDLEAAPIAEQSE